MWWRELKLKRRLAWPLRLAVVLVAGGLTAGCWQPLYGSSKVPGGEGVQDKFAYKLTVTVSTSQFTSYLDPVTGRPDSSIEWVVASYQLIELTTGKMVLNDIAYAHVSYDIPGSQQRFAGQRARRDAEDRAIVVAADAVRNRLASYFVAGT
jgi:LPS-assembly lipoprotein